MRSHAKTVPLTDFGIVENVNQIPFINFLRKLLEIQARGVSSLNAQVFSTTFLLPSFRTLFNADK